MHDCNYNKIALLHELRRLLWRIPQYKKDSKSAGHPLCEKMYDELAKDLQKYSKKLEDAVVGLAKEGKFTFCDKC
jgi:hypothetical protein